MSPVREVLKALGLLTRKLEGQSDDEERLANDAYAHLISIDGALRALTAEHGSQCQCRGCEVLRSAK